MPRLARHVRSTPQERTATSCLGFFVQDTKFSNQPEANSFAVKYARKEIELLQQCAVVGVTGSVQIYFSSKIGLSM